MDPDGTNTRRLTKPIEALPPVGPRWSPDGRRIAFVGECGGGLEFHLCIMNSDGTGITSVATQVAFVPPAWSPDGTRLAFTRPAIADGQAVEGPVSIWIIGADGTGEVTLVEDAERPAWSPDGERIAFVSGREGTTKIYLVNVDGNGLQRISDGPFDGSPAWSPDGNHIALTSGRAGKPEYLSDYARGVQASGRDPIYTDPQRPIHPAKDISVMQASPATRPGGEVRQIPKTRSMVSLRHVSIGLLSSNAGFCRGGPCPAISTAYGYLQSSPAMDCKIRTGAHSIRRPT
jgi:Tol biopolymer transport system component